MLLAMALATVISAAAADGPPDFPQTTDEKFDPAALGSYAGDHAPVYEHIDRNLDAHLGQLQRWLRQRSISAQNDGVREMAEMLRSDLESMGFAEAELVETSGHPGVWGYYDAGADQTLVIYLMYDVQPVDPEDWESPPFAAEVVDHPLGRVIMARGATNQKGPERAFFNALDSILAVEGKLPVNLMVAAEGEEELGSPNYPEVIAKYEDRLRGADGVFFPFNSQDPNGDVGMFLGVKGILYFELEARGNETGGPKQAEIHGSLKAMVDSPVLRLIQAIASMTTPDGNTITIPGYYDPIRAPTHEEEMLINTQLDDWADQEELMKQAFAVDRFANGLTGRDLLMRYLYTTTLNVDGIWGGYTEEGTKTILPHMATAKMDSRLAPNQKPDEALALIRKHLDDHGFGDLEIRQLSGYPPAQTSVSAPLVQEAIRVYNKYSMTPDVTPRIGGSAPYYVFTDLGLPLVAGGIGHGSGAHAPNEYMVIEPKEGSTVAGLAEIEKFYVDLLYALAE
jgi:acetylornithine deacetylase/succinyl-diaminopimelate desuccinylase-like protein